ncbi:MAG: GNAT family N-acetyltransferase [Verrucomicrobia bacterium]|nr:GNAT family N-acetyltransferase [Verrucomicrobiota bacterium]
MIKIEAINTDSPHLASVMALHRADGKNLGMFPKGAFQERATEGQILLALTGGGECVGYLLYRIARERAAIVHFCVRADFRGKGAARALVEKLKSETKQLRGVGLYCRRDYEANAAWPKFGFVAVAAKRGRGSDGAELEYWWLDHNHPDLFSFGAASSVAEAKLRVVIDANVFYDLHERNTLESEDSKALLADWLQESIELCLTPEIYNEIRRAPSEEQRQRSRSLVSRHRILKTEDARVQGLIAELESDFPDAACLRDDSDLRQVAHSIAADVPFFVTRDTKLVERCDSLFDSYGLRVLHPTDLINELDSLRREAEYRPARLEGSRLTANLLRAEQVEIVVEAFLRPNGEKAGDFAKAIRHFLAKPQEHECKLAMTGEKEPVALLVKSRTPDSAINITLFRLTNHSLAPTVARHLLRSLIENASRSVPLLRIVDADLATEVKLALEEMGFVPSSQGWWKVGVGQSLPAEALKQSVGNFTLPDDVLATIRAGIDGYLREESALGAADIERVLWPAKVADAPLDSFVVPIQAQWAQHFFDADLGSELLFGLRDELHLGIEGAYYCSRRNTHLQHPGRVLWYVSKGPEGRGSMTVKACSRIEEVFVGRPKEVFKKFSRLGVYQWRDVLNAAGGNLNEHLLAFRFAMTERFARPVSLEELERLGVAPPIMSPRKITPEQFTAIYRMGKQL